MDERRENGKVSDESFKESICRTAIGHGEVLETVVEIFQHIKAISRGRLYEDMVAFQNRRTIIDYSSAKAAEPRTRGK